MALIRVAGDCHGGREGIAMPGSHWPLVLGAAIVGLLLGAAAMVGADAVDRYTSTDRFCTSCHAMATLASDPHFRQSAHIGNPQGAGVRCVDCHIVANNLASETWAHATSGLRDVAATFTHDYDDPQIWEKRRVALAHEVRDEMRRDDSAACRTCHTAGSIHPASEAGRAAHALLAERQITCIDCHYNLVHAPVPPLESFLRSAGFGKARNKPGH